MEEIKRYRTGRKVCTFLGTALAALGLLCLAGLVVCLVLLGLSETHLILYAILCGSFAGGALVGGLAGWLLFKRGNTCFRLEKDAIERSRGEESFLVAEKTFLHFGENSFTVDAEGKQNKPEIPYGECEFFSVCYRRAPKEKGEWGVMIRVPAHYVNKKATVRSKPVLMQLDAKERLYKCLEAHGIPLKGEPPAEGKEGKKFTRIKSFSIPYPQKRKPALLFLCGGGVLFLGGIGFAFFIPVAGALIALLGAYGILHGAMGLNKARWVFSVYEEGFFVLTPERFKSRFLKWEEIDRLFFMGETNEGFLFTEAVYGSYHFPCTAEAYALLKERCPDKCPSEEAFGA